MLSTLQSLSLACVLSLSKRYQRRIYRTFDLAFSVIREETLIGAISFTSTSCGFAFFAVRLSCFLVLSPSSCTRSPSRFFIQVYFISCLSSLFAEIGVDFHSQDTILMYQQASVVVNSQLPYKRRRLHTYTEVA